MTLVHSGAFVLENAYNLYAAISGQGRTNIPYALPASSMLFKHLVNSAGEHNMAIDAGSTWYQFQNTADHIAIVNRIAWVLHDNGISPEKFGGMTALPGGIDIEFISSGGDVQVHFLDDVNITTTDDFGFLCGDHFYFDSGAGVDSLTFVWDLAEHGMPLMMMPSDCIRMTVQDCLGGLDEFVGLLQGTLHHIGRF